MTTIKLIVKQLQGGECTIEALPTTSILDVKRLIYSHLQIPIEEQKLLLLGRTLADDQTVQAYPIKDGTKLNLVVKKPEGLREAAVKYFKSLGMTDGESVNATNRLLKIAQEKFNKLSWDDIDRLSMDCLLDESGQSRPAPQNEPDEEMYSL
ncbi:ubiquitin-like protein 4A [Amyelois transitella]|uniref:ubiquitin-like protein 4A n=1 Tax=Amyelois transitella TaxID=680683 RepID=UPI00067C76B6|nr:ubiquitin-like protein 4A [Amyelois transitella]